MTDDDLLAQRAAQTPTAQAPDDDALLAARASQTSAAPKAVAAAAANSQPVNYDQYGNVTNNYEAEAVKSNNDPASNVSRVEHGLAGSSLYGPAQLAEHVPVLSQATDYLRDAIHWGLNKAGFNTTAELYQQPDLDKIVSQRENEYQAARTAAGQSGFDWWGAAGIAANPLNYLGGGLAVKTMLGRVGQAAGQGAVMGAETPGATPGSYWQDKVKDVGLGSVFGGGLGAIVEGLVPALNAGIKGIRSMTGTLPDNSAAADAIVNKALNVKGVDPTSIPAPVITAQKKAVQNALDAGADDVSPRSVLNSSVNQSLPFPYQLTRGMQTEDATLRTQEYNLSTNTKSPQGAALKNVSVLNNKAAHDNLDALGANGGNDEVSTGLAISNKVKQWWQQLTDQKNQLYDSVRNSQGQSALMDGATAAKNVQDVLSSHQESNAWEYLLPKGIKDTLTAIQNNELPMSVSTWQALDHNWGEMAYGASDGSVRTAINKMRTIMGNATLADDAGQASVKAYQAAKAAHAQQMSYVTEKLPNGTPNPNYQPIVDSVIYKGDAPETIFPTHFLGESGSVAGKNKQFLSQLDPDFDKVIGQTLMNHIQTKATGAAATDTAPVSEKVLRDWAGGPQKSSLMENLLPPNLVQTFRNLSRVQTLNRFFPAGSTPNMSGTAGASRDLATGLETPKSSPWVDAAKQELAESPIVQGAASLPVVKSLLNVSSKAKANQELNMALNPDVTLKSMLGSSVRAAGNKRTLSKLLTPGAVAPSQTPSNPP